MWKVKDRKEGAGDDPNGFRLNSWKDGNSINWDEIVSSGNSFQ